MKKIVLRVAAGVGIFVLLLLLVLEIVTLAFGSKIKVLVLSELNKQLNTEVQVNGDINFSFFSHFPNAAISFDNVLIKESLPEKANLVSCKQVSLLFSIWNLFHAH